MRSELVESHDVADFIAMDPGGSTIATGGEVDRPIFYRSVIKAFQATVAQGLGADLAPEELAVAASSHSGYPIHLALVRRILTGGGLDESHLRTTADWPLTDRRVVGKQEPREPAEQKVSSGFRPATVAPIFDHPSRARMAVAAAAAVAMLEVMTSLGVLSDAAMTALDDVAHPPVRGGGRPVGAIMAATGI